MEQWRLKWWQSGLLGLLIGLGIFYAQYSIPRTHQRNWGGPDFFKFCLKQRIDDPASFKDLVVTPQMDGAYIVTGTQLTHHAYRPFVCEVPPNADMGEPQLSLPGGASIAMQVPLPQGTTFVKMLQVYEREFPWVQFQYKWWLEPKLILWGYPAIGVFLFGIVVPLLTTIWSGGELWPAKQGEKYDLSRFNSEKEPTKPVPASAPKEALETVIAQMDEVVSAAREGLMEVSEAKMHNVQAPCPPPKLSNEPLAPTMVFTPEDQKDYKGEFYPTEAHGANEHEK